MDKEPNFGKINSEPNRLVSWPIPTIDQISWKVSISLCIILLKTNAHLKQANQNIFTNLFPELSECVNFNALFLPQHSIGHIIQQKRQEPIPVSRQAASMSAKHRDTWQTSAYQCLTSQHGSIFDPLLGVFWWFRNAVRGPSRSWPTALELSTRQLERSGSW